MPANPSSPQGGAPRVSPSREPEVSLGGESPASPSTATGDLVRRLSQHSLKESRYKLEGEVARGGMGAILRVWDEDLRRHLAMKVIVGRGEATGAVEPNQLSRFLEEAQVTGQLDHPGIVPVHELGLDPDGRVYFTMKLVKGRDLKAIFDLVFEEKEGWNETRALGVLLRVCEAMAFAHAKGVIHRDLKPSNVMVGEFGEVLVMDWGLARVRGHEDAHDEQLLARSGLAQPAVRTERSLDRDGPLESPHRTAEGDVMGTPAYMPPEQARGEIERLSPRSDVYSVGAMLYHLLARQPPYVAPRAQWSPVLVLERVRGGPPRALGEFGRPVPAELVAICEKAMSREAEGRYADMQALAEDLRAFLEHRVVRAYETGAWAEARKWVQRNKSLSAACAAGLSLTVGGLALNSYNQTRAARTIAEKERVATQKANDVLSLSAIQDLRNLEARADALWPARPENLPAYDAWLRDARALLEGSPDGKRPSLAEHRRKLAEIRGRALAPAPGSPSTFEDAQDQWWHEQLAELVADLEAFADATTGLDSDGISERHGWGIRRRREVAATIEERTRSGPEARARWNEAIEAIASNPAYLGLQLAPQLGLVPLGEDPDSHLWEFAHPETGESPARGADGRLVPTEESGLVFVLLPGGTFLMGAQRRDPSSPNYDPEFSDVESSPEPVRLSPFFISKFEMTQGQWLRLHGRNPSSYPAGEVVGGGRIDLRNPVENVDWRSSATCMRRSGLVLPTEAQWEYAARAGTVTRWFTGDEPASLAASANFADARLRAAFDDPTICSFAPWDDGFAVHGPVGSYRPNAFGLHDTAGNVMEWCQDLHCPYSVPPRSGDGVRDCPDSRRVIRGGAWDGTAAYLKSATRIGNSPDFASHNLGLRPARAVED